MAKNSLTHPLEIAAVAVPGGGMIGMTLCPGKKQPQAITGPWDRDLAADMSAIKAFGAQVLVTLMEFAELEQAAVPAHVLGAAASERGIAWFHLPIADFQPPDAAFERAWLEKSPALRISLQGGQNIVLHCRGGRGRSGMIAARLLVDLGFEPKEAIAAIRAVNPLAMETAAQEEYIRSNAQKK